MSRGDSKEALDYVQRYLAVNPPSPEVLMLGVRADRKLGDSTGAGAFAQQHQSQFPDSAAGADAPQRPRSMSEDPQALGQRLKAERERRGMSTQKIANGMHLDEWVIDALEAGDYQRIGPSVYAKGHLKKYASLLGVSAAPPRPTRCPRHRRRPVPIRRPS